MTGIIPGEPNGSNDVMNAFGSNFNDTAQNLFNADYLGFDSRLTNSTTPNLKNVFYSTFQTDDAEVSDIFVYDEVNDLYKTYDASGIGTNYVIIEADDDTISWTNNNTQLDKIGKGKWILFGTSGTDEVIRANIHKSLFYGTTGNNPLVLDFTNVTGLKTPVSRDVGKRGHFYRITKTGSNASTQTGSYTGTFVNTATNTDCSNWSLINLPITTGSPNYSLKMPSTTTLISRTTIGTTDELGTDRTADEATNPDQIIASGTQTIDTLGHKIEGIVICSGDISWVFSETLASQYTAIDTDFFSDNSIPDFILSEEDFLTSTLIFKDTTSSTVTNATTAINSTIDATSTEQISVAFNGSTFEDVNNSEIVRATPTGTALWRKIVITRTDLSKEDKVTEQAVKFNYY